MTIHSEVEWVPVRSTQRKELVQITESNALDVIAEVGGAVYFKPGSKPRLSVGGTTREIGNWVDRGGSVWPDPHRDGAPFVPEPTTEPQEHAARWDGKSRPHLCETCGARVISRLESWVHVSNDLGPGA